MRERKKSGAYEYPLAINKFFISYTIGEYVIVKPAYASKLPAALVITLNWIYKSSCRHATPAGSSYPSSVLFSLLHTWYWNPTESRFLGSRLPRLSLNIRINLLFSGQDREFSFHDTILSLSLYTFFLLILSFCVFFSLLLLLLLLLPLQPTDAREIILPLRGIFFLIIRISLNLASLNVFHFSMTFIIIDVSFGERKNESCWR